MTTLDKFYQFIELYEAGEFLQGLQLILTTPSMRYDEIESTESSMRFIINYADAVAFKSSVEAIEANRALRFVIQKDSRHNVLFSQFIEMLVYEEALLHLFTADSQELRRAELPAPLFHFFYQVCQETLPSEYDLLAAKKYISPPYQNFIENKYQLLRNWQHFKRIMPATAKIIEEEKSLLWQMPWHAFYYAKKISLPNFSKNEALIVFTETSALDFKKTEGKDTQTLFILDSVPQLLQLCANDSFIAALERLKASLYILDLYPNSQLLNSKIQEDFRCVYLDEDMSFCLPPHWEHALHECIKQSPKAKLSDTPAGNWLYALSKVYLKNKDSQKYGLSRAAALQAEWDFRAWYDSHKGLIPQNMPVETPRNLFVELLSNLANKRVARKKSKAKKIKIVHVVPQLVDIGHAPTKLLMNLIENCDKQQFDCSLLVTERLTDFLLEYPITPYSSESTEKRGADTLSRLEILKCPVQILSKALTYEDAAEQAKKWLSEKRIDIAIFHGPDEINLLCATQCDVPVRVLFDHGTLPTHYCFEKVILSTEEALKVFNNQPHRGANSYVLHFAIDAKKNWEKKAYSLQVLGLPSDCFPLTTISNHLETRLGKDMIKAISYILQKCPEAIYAPIGPVNHPQKLKAAFAEYGVEERVFFLGHQSNPSQCARTMKLYLNEFPFGSGLALLDAMAAGCPVVSMYDADGIQQARYGGVYFGIDHAIQTGKIDDYVQLACDLIQNPKLYKEWSQHAVARYQKYADVASFVKEFEGILKQ